MLKSYKPSSLKDYLIFFLPEISVTIILSLVIYFIFKFSDISTPFVISTFFAIFFHPLYDFLRKFKIPSPLAAILIVLLILTLVILAFAVVIPAFYSQFLDFLNLVPKILEKINTYFLQIQKYFGSKIKLTLDKDFILSQIINNVQTIIKEPSLYIFSELFKGVKSIFSIIINIAIIPLVTYYLIKDGVSILPKFLKAIPPRFRASIEELILDIVSSINGYIKGQVFIAFLVGTYIGVGLSIIGLKYALMIGVISGIFNLVPFLGFWSGFISALLVALVDASVNKILGVCVVFFTEVLLENLISPIIISRNVGVHPVIALLAIMIGVHYGGFLGLLISVPLSVAYRPIFSSIYKKLAQET